MNLNLNGRKRFSMFLLVVVYSLITGLAHADAPPEFDPGLMPFSVDVGKKPLRQAISLRTVMPGKALSIRISHGGAEEFSATQGDQKLKISPTGHIKWRAPNKPGYYPIVLLRNKDKRKVELQVFVLRPASQIVNGKLKGYQIGSYPSALKGLETYKPPAGFIEVTPALEQLLVSPHFRLGQFLCKQQSGYPKYLLLRADLLNKLELLLKTVNAQGIRADSFVVMSGYRTPFYNKAIGNVTNSRHIYGGAADIFIDVKPVNDYMDDLNGDGLTNLKDAEYLYGIADKLVSHSKHPELMGGVGLYDKTPAHGPFVHVDVRGTPARWGHK
ncbi:MAG: D-Ala-D-Ala carboxypeptidase family metallohydrolase [Zhongshania sp.]|uniref:D-Ala-D-Ala carboxypeptidase family metallohydrolase n=1 Tax=Zhongshania sp. TaxID=1971902 RepID=UPI002626056F|nr:D-Ala-D-Ala carboxypeptidase family metallohydrolase [Zhongshania sp.]MDF1693503.1 D-Ala-D-Ala carboxypeptidase family metallohydrolase [Zhongshania sp.]